jgi:ubiquinone/menaquinone biosynthesis C-methylase UbiE
VSDKKRATAERLQREIEHHREIAERAETVWNWDSPSGTRRADRRAQMFVACGGLAPGERALELGCGTGVFLSRVSGCGASIAGVDLSRDLLARARSAVRERRDVTLVCGNAERLPFPDRSFDVVYGSSVLHHLDLTTAAAETFRVLRPGGRAVFTEPNILNPQVAFMFHVGMTKRYFGVSPDEKAFSRFRALITFQEAGFRRVVVTPFDFLHPATPRRWLGAVDWLGRGLERFPLLNELAGSLLVVACRG